MFKRFSVLKKLKIPKKILKKYKKLLKINKDHND